MNAHPTNSQNRLLDQRAATPAHVVQRRFAEETVVLNVNTGHYHGLNATGGVMLDVLTTSGTIGAAIVELADRYGRAPRDIEPDVLEFVEQLIERDLLVLQPRR